jgi:hypothetical protein
MKASEVRLQKLLDGKIQYRVPLFQRTYSWDEENWERLWDDILEIYAQDEPTTHFMGAIVTLPLPDAPERASKHLLIDGQQRLTTILALLAAIRRRADEAGDPDRLGDQIFEECLINKFATTEEERFKLIPTQRDRDALTALILGDGQVAENGIIDAWQFFYKAIDAGDAEGKQINLLRLKACVTDYLDLVSITLDQGDSPNRIFESLNNTGMQLGPSDLIRNYLFMRILDVAEQERVYKQEWFPMQEALQDQLSDFFWRYLMKDGALPRWDDTYDYMRDALKDGSDLEIPGVVRTLGAFSRLYLRLWKPETYEPDGETQAQLMRLNAWEVDVAYPFFLNLLDWAACGLVMMNEVKRVLGLTESFIVRRTICGVPTNRLRRIFAKMSGEVDSARCIESCADYLRANEWPSDAEFEEKFCTARVYVSGRLSRTRLVLSVLERSFGHKEPVALQSQITIEHVMPQTLNAEWRQMLGERCDEVHSRWLHTIGNLTLSGYNSEMGNDPFDKKKEILRGSHIELNSSIVNQDVWNEDRIVERGKAMAVKAVQIWPR